MGFINDTVPVFAQWNYRILCHPLSRNLPTNRLRYTDDLSNRLKRKMSTYQASRGRSARFMVNPVDSDKFEDKHYTRGLLDELMEEIPGLNNYPGKLNDENLDSKSVEWDGKTPKDVSRYHRWFKVTSKDAFGMNTVHRGFNDDFMFAARTTQDKIAGVQLKYKCRWKKINNKWTKVCPKPTEQKWTWAIPLEIIYLNPLYSWNPYKLKYFGDKRTPEGKKATEGGKTGDCRDPKKALNGLNSVLFYQTPAELFGNRRPGSTADTVRGVMCVQGPDGKIHKTKASGTYVFLPPITGVGSIRMSFINTRGLYQHLHHFFSLICKFYIFYCVVRIV